MVDDAGNVLETFDYYPFGLLMPKRNTAGANTIEKYTGHELDDEGGINLFYAGARYLDPALGRWMAVDPKADDFPAWSPYNYTLNEPIGLIDPDGRAPIDDYGFDIETGQLSLIRETDDDFDIIYTGTFEEDGNFEKTGESIKVSKGVLQGDFFKDISESGFVTRDLSEGLKTVKFLSFSSEIEFSAWAFTNSTEEGLSVSPWATNTYRSSRDYYAKKDRVGYLGEKKFSIHTHPSTREGYGYGWPSRPADIDASKLNPSYLHYILSRRHGVTRYYPNGSTFSVKDLNRYLK